MNRFPEHVIIEVWGEGKTDVGGTDRLAAPNQGVVPILVHKICRQPGSMFVKSRPRPYLIRKGSLQEKVRFARVQARYNGSDGSVFVTDADGDVREFRRKLAELQRGRDEAHVSTPMAVGVCLPCIEAWLLADNAAICRACKLPRLNTEMPDRPEHLPSDRAVPDHPKRLLARAVGRQTRDLAAADKWAIAREADVETLTRRCQVSFRAFRQEVESAICPLFR